MKILVPKTPVQKLNYRLNNNSFYIKRDDLLPFSFGGNKVRIVSKYFEDILRNNYNYVISFGGSYSNMNRVVANMSAQFKLPCTIILPKNENNTRENFNKKILGLFDVEIIHAEHGKYTETIQATIDQKQAAGFKPYYIYGNAKGEGTEPIAAQAYREVYKEITTYEKDNGTFFDLIFHASGTGITQTGLISGQIEAMDIPRIIGISVSRDRHQVTTKIYNQLCDMYGDNYTKLFLDHIIFLDQYRAAGFGTFNPEIARTIQTLLTTDGIALNTTYTGKAFWGMTEFIREHTIQNKKILFIHTGGTPMFFDDLNTPA